MTEHKTSLGKQKNNKNFEKNHHYFSGVLFIYFEVYNTLGVILSKQKQYREAEQAYRRAIEINPDYKPPYYNLGVLQIEKEKSEDIDNVSISALICASAAGYADVVILLLEDEGVDIHAVDKKGRTALVWASARGHVGVVRLLIDEGADIGLADNEGRTALMWASVRDHVETVRLLLDQGADIDANDIDGCTALTWASVNGHVKTVRLLLDRGANINATDKDGRTALMWASVRGHVETVRLLLDQGADIDAFDGGNQNDSTNDQDVILDKIKELDVDIAHLEQTLDHIYPYVIERQKELSGDKLDRVKGKLKEALEEVATIPFPERKEIIRKLLNDLEPLKGEVPPPLPAPDLSGNTYPLYVKRTDPFKHLEEVWAPWLVRYTPSLKHDYLDQKQLRERDPVLFTALSNRLKRTEEQVRDYIPPYRTPFHLE